jgi:SHS2 domain-containing protein
MMDRRFAEIEHTADIAIRVWGRDLAELFANAAYGMASYLTAVETVPLTAEAPVELTAEDAESLLVAWLSELLYIGERANVVFTTFEMVTVTPNQLEAVARGGPFQEHHGHIKAVTFSDLELVLTDEGYETVIVFDV